MVNIGFIGLGKMGQPMARHLLEAGHDLWVFDINPEAVDKLEQIGASSGGSPAEVGEKAAVVFLSLPRPKHVEEVTTGKYGLKGAMESGSVVVDLSTSLPGITQKLQAELAENEIYLLGAPVSRGEIAAKDGTLSVMVGGPSDVYEDVVELIKLFAKKINHVGEEPGHGHAVKLLNNYLSFTSMVATSEAAALGQKMGLDLETIIDTFDSGTGRNSATEVKFPDHIIPETYDRGFTLELTEKDIQLFMKFSSAYDTPIFAGAVISQIVTGSRAAFGADADITQIYQYVCSLANVD